MSRVLLKDESKGEDNSPDTTTRDDITPENDQKTRPDKANDTAPRCDVYLIEEFKKNQTGP